MTSFPFWFTQVIGNVLITEVNFTALSPLGCQTGNVFFSHLISGVSIESINSHLLNDGTAPGGITYDRQYQLQHKSIAQANMKKYCICAVALKNKRSVVYY